MDRCSRWSRQETVASFRGLSRGIASGATASRRSWVSGLSPGCSGTRWPVSIVAGALLAHALVDQLGFMGNNFLFPFRRHRSEGLKMMHSDQMMPNLLAVWLSCLVIFWNLYLALPWAIPALNLAKLFFYGALLPVGIGMALRRLCAQGGHSGNGL